MPHVPVFLERADARLLCLTLSRDPDVAFIQQIADGVEATGVPCWRAYQSLLPDHDGSIAIWHIPSGPVVVKNDRIRGPDYLEVEKPFDGWHSPSYTNAPDMPLLGAKPQFFELQFEVSSTRNPALLGLSGMSWVGSRYEKPPASAKLFWQRLQRLAKKHGKLVFGDGITSHPESSFLCWPNALERIRAEQPSRVRA